eukprot:scaffold3226_cov160-Amphora_coffeaeformis.AAC.6
MSFSILRKTNISPLYYVGLSTISSPSRGDPAQLILNRAVLLYDRLASLETSSTLNKYLSDQLTTMIVFMARHLRENDGTVSSTNDSNNEMSNEQLELLTAILDTMERQIAEQQQRFKNSEAEGWRALYQAAQLIERAIMENVPYTQVRALVESYAKVKATLEQQQLQKKAAEEASFAELWQKVAPFVPSTITPPVVSKTFPQATAQATKTTTRPSQKVPPVPASTEVVAKQLEDLLLQDENNNSNPIPTTTETSNSREPKPPPIGRRGAVPSPSPTPVSNTQVDPSPPKEIPREGKSASGDKTVKIPGFSDPSVQERNQLARQLEEALLSDVETSDPVQAFVESLKVPVTTPSPPTTPATQSPLESKPKSVSTPTPSFLFGNPAIKKQRDMAQRLEDALLAESDDDETDPVESFLASLQNPVPTPEKVDPIISDSPSPDQSFEDRVESFVQNLRQIRNVNSSDLESRPPAAPMSTVARKDSADTMVGEVVDPSPSQESKIKSSEQSNGGQSERPRGSTTSPTSPFYFANSTFYFANMTYVEALESEIPEVTEMEKQELKAMENKMVVYLEATRPAVERTVQFAKDFAVSASPIVQKGVSSLGSAWIGLYSAAKTVAEKKWTETKKKEAKDSDLLNVDGLGAVQSVLENIFVSIESGQLGFPFGRKNSLDVLSSDFKRDIGFKDEASEQMISSDSTSETYNYDDNTKAESNCVDGESEMTGTRATHQSDLTGDGSSQIGSGPRGPSMEELAMIWVEMNRDTKVKGNSFSNSWPSPEKEVSATLDGPQFRNESEEVDIKELGLQELMSINKVQEDGDSNESLRSDDWDRIEALKRKLYRSTKDETERPLKSDPKMLEDALADIRIKLASAPIGMSGGESVPLKLTSTFESGVDDRPNYPTSGSRLTSKNEAAPKKTRSVKSLSNDLSSHWVDLANEWKERNNDARERTTKAISFDADPVSSDDGGGTVPNRSNYEELAKEWKERNRSQ